MPSDTPSPEALKAAEAIMVRLHEWSGRARYLMENEPNPQELIGDEIARHIDAAYADLRERCERLRKVTEAAEAYRVATDAVDRESDDAAALGLSLIQMNRERALFAALDELKGGGNG